MDIMKANETAGSIDGGVAYWVFWLMLAVIVFLAAVILIRDKSIREGVKNIFFRVRRKIHDAGVKIKISREKEKAAAFLVELGKKAWEKNIHPDGTGNIDAQLHQLRREEGALENDIEALQKKMDQDRRTFEGYKKDRETAVNEQEQLKSPEVKEFNRLKKQLHDIEKNTTEKEKLKARHEKKVATYKKKIVETREDNTLSKIEIQTTTSQLEGDINRLEQDIKGLTRDLEPLVRERGNPARAIEDIKPRITRYDETIKRFKDELKGREKEYETQKRNQVKKKGNLEEKRRQLQQQANTRFGKLGEVLNARRIENPVLSRLYSELDSVEATIKRLEKQLSR
ncbi:MAG: hypothetical protein GY940_05245 [bacterium]|nr:hypothetical protein [bacterium]